MAYLCPSDASALSNKSRKVSWYGPEKKKKLCRPRGSWSIVFRIDGRGTISVRNLLLSLKLVGRLNKVINKVNRKLE